MAAAVEQARASSSERILVATDLGPAGDAATRVALARAPRTGAEVAVCHVCPDGVTGARRVRQHLHEVAGPEADTLEVMVHAGDPADRIAACAQAWRADLVVLGRPEHPTGILRRLFRPGVVDQVVRYAPCRVLVARRAAPPRLMIVGVDADQPLSVLEAAVREHAARGAGKVVVAHWIPPVGSAMSSMTDAVVPLVSWEDLVASALPPIEAAARQVGLRAEVRVMAGEPGRGLIVLAEELDADLVMVGTHGRAGLARIALGSVAEHVASAAPCSVMVVRLGDS